MNTPVSTPGPRRILIFSLVYYPRFIGGAEVAVKEITDRISAKEIEFDMITMRKQAPAFERIGNVNVYRVGIPWSGTNTRSSKIFPLSKYLFIFYAFFKARSLNRTRTYHATWSVMANYAGFAALFFKMFNSKIPFILTLQEGDPIDHIQKRVGILYPTFKKIFTRADHITAISNYLADWARKMGAVVPISVVPNGVDYQRFSHPISPDKRKQLRQESGLQDSDIVLVTASRLVHKNAIEDIISSLRFLEKSYKLLILGTGPDEAALKDQATKLDEPLVKSLDLIPDPSRISGGTRRVIFKGFVPHDQLPEYLQIADVFVRPSRSEGLGNSFLEAMAAGIPVIATPVGGISDFLKDGETGLFCEVDNPRSIAQKVEKLIKDRESREYIVKQARDMVKAKYKWEGIAQKMQALLADSST